MNLNCRRGTVQPIYLQSNWFNHFSVCNEGFLLWYVRRKKSGSVTGSTFSSETSTASLNMTLPKMSDYATVTLKMAKL